MNFWRYQICEGVEIDAPVEEVYRLASDPEIVPSYAAEVARIEVLRMVDANTILVRSYLRVAGLILSFRYRYHYRAPVHYGGVQEGGRLLRAYFTFHFRSYGRGTTVSHSEGFLSAVPLLAWIVGSIYFRIIARD